MGSSVPGSCLDSRSHLLEVSLCLLEFCAHFLLLLGHPTILFHKLLFVCYELVPCSLDLLEFLTLLLELLRRVKGKEDGVEQLRIRRQSKGFISCVILTSLL